MLARDLLAIGLARARGEARGLGVLGPRAGRAARLLVAEREVQQRAELGVDPIALFEFWTRRREIAGRHQRAPLPEERLGHGDVGVLRVGRVARGQDGADRRRGESAGDHPGMEAGRDRHSRESNTESLAGPFAGEAARARVGPAGADRCTGAEGALAAAGGGADDSIGAATGDGVEGSTGAGSSATGAAPSTVDAAGAEDWGRGPGAAASACSCSWWPPRVRANTMATTPTATAVPTPSTRARMPLGIINAIIATFVTSPGASAMAVTGERRGAVTVGRLGVLRAGAAGGCDWGGVEA